MAFSKSLPKGQIPLDCQLCQRQKTIKWKCIDCDLLICEDCPQIHKKFKDADKHRILDIKDIGKNPEEDMKFYRLHEIPCKRHHGQVNCLFCPRCDKLSCPVCVSEIHKQHDFVPIQKAYESKIADMKKEQRLLKIRDQEFGSRELIVEYMRKIERANHEKSVKEVLSHNEVLKSELDKYTDSIVDELNTDWNSSESKLKSELKEIEQNRNKLDKKNKKIGDLSNPSNQSKCFDETEGVTRLLWEGLPTIRTNRYQVRGVLFGKIQRSNVGTIQYPSSNYPVNFGFQLSREIKTDFGFVDDIVAANSSLLCLNNSTKSLQRVNTSGYSAGKLHGDKIEACGIASASNHSYETKTFFVANRQSVLKQADFNKMELTDSRYSVSPWLITAVHYTKDNTVILGATDTMKMKHAIIFTSSDGRMKVIHESIQPTAVSYPATECTEESVDTSYLNNESNRLTFAEPKSITSTINKNVFLIDANQERVTILNEGGYVRRYVGNTRVGYEHQFTPTGMTTTPSGRVVLVVDPENNIIHILDTMGEFVTYCRTTDIGIQKPCCLDFYAQGNVYIGCAEGSNIFDVKYSEQ